MSHHLFLLALLGCSFLAQGTYDISQEPGWENFVREASKATGGAPRDMDNFVAGVNGNLANVSPNITKQTNALDENQTAQTRTPSTTTFGAPTIAPSAMHNDAACIRVGGTTKGLLIALFGYLVV